MRNFLKRNLVVEIIIAVLLFTLLWTVTRVQPNGELSSIGYQISLKLQVVENYLFSWFTTTESHGLGLTQPRTKYEMFMNYGFCGLAYFSNLFVKNSLVLSYFVVIPAFLIVIFAYNRAGPDHFSRPARVIFSIVLIAMIVVLTLKVIEIQGIQAKIVETSKNEFLMENFDYRCDDRAGNTVGSSGAASLSLFLGNLTVFLSEIRIYILGLVLWIIGKEHADIRRLRQAGMDVPRDVGENKND